MPSVIIANSMRAFQGTAPPFGNSNESNPLFYSSLFTTMVIQHHVAPVFSIALNHEGSSGPAGYLALDGLSPMATQGCWASTPVLPQLVNGVAEFMWYIINLDSLVVSGHEVPNCGSTNDTYIIDSGTSYNILPTLLADAIDTAFIPPATYSDTLGYRVNCSAVLPNVGIEIGGVVLDMASKGFDEQEHGCR